MLSRVAIKLSLLLPLIGFPAGRCLGGPPLAQSPLTSRENPQPDPAALQIVKTLASSGNLALSTDDRLVKHFHRLARAAYTTKDGVRGTNYVVERDGNRVAILALNDEGLSFLLYDKRLHRCVRCSRAARNALDPRARQSFLRR